MSLLCRKRAETWKTSQPASGAQSLSLVQFFAAHGLQPARLLCPWRFSRQEYWSGLPCPPPGDLPDPGMEPGSPTLWADSLPSEPPGKPNKGWSQNTNLDPHPRPLPLRPRDQNCVCPGRAELRFQPEEAQPRKPQDRSRHLLHHSASCRLRAPPPGRAASR